MAIWGYNRYYKYHDGEVYRNQWAVDWAGKWAMAVNGGQQEVISAGAVFYRHGSFRGGQGVIICFWWGLRNPHTPRRGKLPPDPRIKQRVWVNWWEAEM